MTTSIEICDLRLKAYHGVLPQERTVGNAYRIDVTIEADLKGAIESDDLQDTINYATAVEAIRDEMRTPSALLEHVAGRILRRLAALATARVPIRTIDLRLAKLSPPVAADLGACAVRVQWDATAHGDAQ